MSYREDFRRILTITLIGFIIPLVFTLFLAYGEDPKNYVEIVLGFTLILGPMVSMIICSIAHVQGFLSATAKNIFSGIIRIFFASVFSLNPIFLVFGIIKLTIGLFLMIPTIVFMAVSYVINFVYLAIMSILEKKNKLEGKESLCQKMDKLVTIFSIVCTVVLSVVFIVIFN